MHTSNLFCGKNENWEKMSVYIYNFQLLLWIDILVSLMLAGWSVLHDIVYNVSSPDFGKLPDEHT